MGNSQGAAPLRPPRADSGDASCRACSDGVETPARAAAAAAAAAAAGAPAAPVYAYQHSGCPLNRKEVGRATWAFLHTMAAYYPVAPSSKQQEEMRTFMHTLGRVYPCGYCADTTSDEMIRNPPRVRRRTNERRRKKEEAGMKNDSLFRAWTLSATLFFFLPSVLK